MPSPSPSTLIPVLTGLISLSLAACAGQPASVGTTAPPEIDRPESLPVYHEASLAERPGLVPEAEKPLVLEVEGQDVVRVGYTQSAEEIILWKGRGGGVVEPKEEAGGTRRVIFWQPEGDDSRGGWRV